MLRTALQQLRLDRSGGEDDLRRRRYLSVTAVCLVGALAAMFIAAGLLAREVRTVKESISVRVSLKERNRQLQRTLLLLQEAETAQRGYLLTGNDRYLAPYDKAVEELAEVLPKVAAQSANDLLLKAHIEEIQKFSSLKLAEVAETLRLTQAGDRAAAMAIVQSDLGQRYMESLRQELALATESLNARVAGADDKAVSEMVAVKELALWTAIALTLAIALAAFQFRALVRSRSAYQLNVETQASILNVVIEEIPESVAIWDRDFHYRLVNKAFERWASKSRDAFVGKSIAEVYGEEAFAELRPMLLRALRGEQVKFERKFPNGPMRHVTSTFSPLILPDGTIAGVIGMAHDVTAHYVERERLETLNAKDSLTGMLNRGGFEEWLEDECKAEQGRDIAVLYVDLDRFKPVNDEHGHGVGDAVLKEFARRLRPRCVRRTPSRAWAATSSRSGSRASGRCWMRRASRPRSSRRRSARCTSRSG